MGDKLWNSINNNVHDIVTELQLPKTFEGINNTRQKHNWVHPPSR